MTLRRNVRFCLGTSAVAMGLAAYPAVAQTPSSAPQDEAPVAGAQAEQENPEQIVVTGTLVRGTAPVGANPQILEREAILETGANSAMRVLGEIPQITNTFNQIPMVPRGGVATATIRPNLRNLPQGDSPTTLVLFDGMRGVPAGTLLTSPDPDVIPPAILERVEVIPDGGSAIYGSDAVGGVINFITRRRFDGFEAAAHAGMADDYHSVDANVTAGKDWGSGSGYISYAFVKHDALFGRDRDYVREVVPGIGACGPNNGTVTITRGAGAAAVTTNYALPGRIPNTIAQCDATDNASFIPREERHSVFGSLTQELAAGLNVDIKAFYTRRETLHFGDPNASGTTGSAQRATVTSANPYYVPIGPADPGVQTVAFSYQGVFDDPTPNTLREYGVSPSVRVDLGRNWQLRVMGTWGRSEIDVSEVNVDAAAQARALAATSIADALNPYNPGASNPSVLRSLHVTKTGPTQQELLNVRAVIDGTLFELPGGKVRLAGGGEYIHEKYHAEQDARNTATGAQVSKLVTDGTREIKGLFGELVLPVFGTDNAIPGIRSLVVSASGRYDIYPGEIGGVFNPKIGVTYKPIDWITVRGNWGKSFNAPGLSSATGLQGVQLFSISPVFDQTRPADFFRPSIILAGANPDLQPQKARTWSVGIDIAPPESGLAVGVTYYNVRMSNLFGLPPFTTQALFDPAYARYVLINPTIAQTQAIVGPSLASGASFLGSYPSVEALYAAGTPAYLLDLRSQNLGLLKQDGIDFSAEYRRGTSFGSAYASVNGTYILNRDVSAGGVQPFVNQLVTPGASRLSLQAEVGASSGPFTGSINLRHSQGYDFEPAIFGQTRVESFNTVNVFASYTLPGDSLVGGTQLTLNIDNLIDQDPPAFNANPGYTLGSTLGRYIQIGIRRKF